MTFQHKVAMVIPREIKVLLARCLLALSQMLKELAAFFVPVLTEIENNETETANDQPGNRENAEPAVGDAVPETPTQDLGSRAAAKEPTVTTDMEKVFGKISEYDSDGELLAVTKIDVTKFYHRDWPSIHKKPKLGKRLSQVGSEVLPDEDLECVD